MMNGGFEWLIGSPTEEDWTSVVDYLAEIRKRMEEDEEGEE